MMHHALYTGHSIQMRLTISIVALLLTGGSDPSYAIEIPIISKPIDKPITLRFREGKSNLCNGEYSTYDYSRMSEEKAAYITESGVYQGSEERRFVSIFKTKGKYLIIDYPLSADGLFTEKPPSIKTNLNQETEEYRSLEKEIRNSHSLFRIGIYGTPIDSKTMSFDAGTIPEEICKKIGNSTPGEKSSIKAQARGLTEHNGATGILLSLSQQTTCRLEKNRIEIETSILANIDISSGLNTMSLAVIEAFSGGRRLIKIQQKDSCEITPFPNPEIKKPDGQSEMQIESR